MSWIRRIGPLVVVFVAASAFVSPAGASQLIARDAKGVKLEVDSKGRALLTYRTGALQRHVLAWGAVDAIHPNEHRKQVAFKVDYSGGWSSFGSNLWKNFRNVCKPTHVELTWLVAACRAPDGSFWALQSWQRGPPGLRRPVDRPTRRLGAPALSLDR